MAVWIWTTPFSYFAAVLWHAEKHMEISMYFNTNIANAVAS